jgi:hypothetical protein
MKANELKELAGQVLRLAAAKRGDEAAALVYKAAVQKIPFSVLNTLGVTIGRGYLAAPSGGFAFADGLWRKHGKNEGIILTIANILGILGEAHGSGSLPLVEKYNVDGAAWYVTDILGSRACKRIFRPGAFAPLKHVLVRWAADPDKWNRRLAAVTIHEISKLEPFDIDGAFSILSTLMQEGDKDVKKGTAWAFRTISRKYPERVEKYLEQFKDSDNNDTRYIVNMGSKNIRG